MVSMSNRKITVYRCAWEIDIEADDPKIAARLAERWMSGRKESCWTVYNRSTGDKVEIEVDMKLR